MAWDFRRPARRSRNSFLWQGLVLSAGLLCAYAQPVNAQAIPPGTNLNGVAAPNGGAWTLQGDAFLSNTTTALVTKALPSVFSIVGVPSGSLITLNDGAAHYGRFSTPASSVLNLSNITFSGGLAGGIGADAIGGALRLGANSTLNLSGTVSFSGNEAATDAGAIHSTGSTSIVGNNAELRFLNNTSSRFGGAETAGTLSFSGSFTNIVIDGNTGPAIFASTGVVLDTQTSGALAITNNNGLSTGGGLRAGADGITIRGSYGSILIEGNTADGPFGGGLAASTPGSIAFNATVGSLAIRNNSSTRAGAIGSGGAISFDGSYGTVLITGNTADGGGAMNAPGLISFGANAPTTIGSMLITGNSVTNSGGVLAPGAGISIVPASIGDILISGNQAGINGGAFIANGPIVISNGNPVGSANNLTITANQAGRHGGAIYGNSVGGIALGGNYANIAITSNVAGQNGGALHALGRIAIGDASSNVGSLIISGNSSTTSRGGAAYAGTAIDLAGNYGSVLISGNTAQVHGGAFYSLGNITLAPASGSMDLINNTAVTSFGGFALASGTFSLTSAGPTLIAGNTAGTSGGAIYAGSNLSLTAAGGDITFTGNRQGSSPNAIYFNNDLGTGTATFDVASGRSILFFDPVESNAANGLLSLAKTGPGIISFDGARLANQAERWSRIYGQTIVSGGTFEIANGATYGVLASDVAGVAPTSFTTLAGTALQGGTAAFLRADSVSLAGDLSIAGRQADRSIFTIDTSALALNGGNVRFNTFLNDASVQNTDLLVLNLGTSATTGTASVIVSNVGGLGAVTVGDGIRIVQTSSGTTAGAFQLGRPVVAGPYEYLLYRGSFDGTAPNDWYLRSTAEPEPPAPPTPPAPTPGPSPLPNYRREVSLYSALPAMGLIYGRTIIDSLHERIGEQRPTETAPATEERVILCPDTRRGERCTTRVQVDPAAAASSRSYASLGWGRIIGSHGNRDGGPGGIFRNGPNFDYDIFALQAGIDLYRGWNADGSRDHAGIYGAIGRIQGDVTHYNGIRAGTNTIDGYSLGAYWTHFGPSGWYLDGVVQGTWFDAEADSKRLIKLDRSGFGLAASLEGGYPIALGNGWIIEPQAQLVYQTLLSGSGHDGAALVHFSDVDSLAGRIGARLARTWALDDDDLRAAGRTMTAWLKASLWNEFLGDPKTSFSSATGPVAFRSDLGGAWAELRAGIDAKIAANTALFATAGYSVGFDGRSHAYDGRLGVKVTW